MGLMVATTGPSNRVAQWNLMKLNYGSDGCNNRTEYVRLHEGPCEKGRIGKWIMGLMVATTGPYGKVLWV